MPIRGQVVGPVFLLGILAIPVCGVAQSVIAVGPGALEFPARVVATAGSPEPAEVTSLSSQPLALNVTVSGGNASDFAFVSACPPAPQQLAAYSHCSIGVTFTPTAPGARTSSLTVTPQSGPARSILLVGQGQAVDNFLSFSLASLTFPALPIGLSNGAPTTIGQLKLVTGNAPVVIQSVSLAGADPQDFKLGSSGYGGTLPPNSQIPLAVSFQPAALGLRTANLVVTSDAGGPLYLPLTGVGTPSFTQLSVPTLVQWPSGIVGDTQRRTFTLQNSGSEPITINHITIAGANAADFFVWQNPCGTLAPQANCSPLLIFTPSAAGLRTATAVVSDTAPGSPHVIYLEGTAKPQFPHIAWQSAPTNSTNFGAVKLNTPGVVESPTVHNYGTVAADLLFQLQGPNAGDFQVDAFYCTVATLPPLQACPVNVTFTPSALGERVAYLVATDTDSGQSIAEALAGSGIPADFPLSPLHGSGLVFSPQVVETPSAPASFGFQNLTQAPVTISGFTLSGGTAGEFSIPQNGCATGTVIPPQGNCSAGIIFTPAALGFRVTTAFVSYEGGASAIQFPVTGTGIASPGSVSLYLEGEGGVTSGLGVPAFQTLQITNSGFDLVTVSQVSIAGPAAADYSVARNDCPAPPQGLAPEVECYVYVKFVPSAVGLRPATLQVSDNATGSPQSVPLLNAGSNGPSVPSSSPGSVNFEAQPLGSSHQQTVFVSSGGPEPVQFAGVTITGPDAADFSAVNGCTTRLVGECSIIVAFTPSVTGLRVAQIEMASDASRSPLLIPVSGVGVTVDRSLSISPPMLVFPSYQGLGYSTLSTLNITSSGNLPVSLTGIRISGPAAGDFRVITGNCPLSPEPIGNSCQANVWFTPSAVGLRIASVDITDNGSQPLQSIPLIGLGAPAFKQLAVTPGAITFNPVAVGSSIYAASFLTIGNVGTLPLTVQSVSIAGADAADFSISTGECTVPASLSLGRFCSFTPKFTPSAAGARTATLTITTDAPNGTQTITLSGTGL